MYIVGTFLAKVFALFVFIGSIALFLYVLIDFIRSLKSRKRAKSNKEVLKEE